MKDSKSLLLALIVLVGFLSANSFAKPVNPDASPEAVALLDYLSEISGKHTLAGQHSHPLDGSARLAGTEKSMGAYPAVFGQDFGFSAPGTWDGINYRQNIVDEAIRRHGEGFIITIMWHAILPTEDEPVRFKESIQGKLSQEEWQELVTPGTHLNERWKSQVDVIAWHLKQLQYANVPVLWRPYHEMNGSWFWWGKKPGQDGYVKLWHMLYERLVDFHGLNNLIWVYNTNEVKAGVDSHGAYFPGHDFVDVFATDVYSGKYTMANYEEMLELAAGKPIALGEVGDVPTADQLAKQVEWVWFMRWYEPSAGGRDEFRNLKKLYQSEHVLTLEELPWTDPEKRTVHFPILK